MKNEVIVITGQRGTGKTTYIHNHISKYDRVIIFDLLGEFTNYETTHDIKTFLQKFSKKKKEQFFYLNYYNPKTGDNDFLVICEAINRYEDILFVVDELDYFCNASYSPRQFSEIIKRGRHQGIGLMVATRRPHEIPRLVTSQVTEFIAFRHLEPRDINYIREICSIEEDDVKSLKNYEYIRWIEGRIEKGKVHK